MKLFMPYLSRSALGIPHENTQYILIIKSLRQKIIRRPSVGSLYTVPKEANEDSRS